jgi:hypothetical protein
MLPEWLEKIATYAAQLRTFNNSGVEEFDAQGRRFGNVSLSGVTPIAGGALPVTSQGINNTYFSARETVGTSSSFSVSSNPAWQAFLTGTSGALTATVEIYVSHDDAHWDLAGTMTLSVAAWSSSADDDQAAMIPEIFGSWSYSKAVIPTGGITGTGAAVSIFGG